MEFERETIRDWPGGAARDESDKEEDPLRVKRALGLRDPNFLISSEKQKGRIYHVPFYPDIKK